MYSIICEARKGHDAGITYLALIDRRRIRTRFWTSDEAAFLRVFATKEQAEARLRSLKYNRARVVRQDEALSILQHQRNARYQSENEKMHDAAASDMELGWDGHK